MNDFVSQLLLVRQIKNNEYNKHYIRNTNKHILAANKIQQFYKNIINKSINNHRNIKGIYKCRINFTTKHLYNSKLLQNLFLFQWCFDINVLIKIYKCRLSIYGHAFYLRPSDYDYIEKIWNLVNGKTANSIIFLSNMDYWKSCSVDLFNSLSTNL